MIAVSGFRSTIVQSLKERVDDEFHRLDVTWDAPNCMLHLVPLDCERYLLAAGLLHPKPLLTQSLAEVHDSIWINALNVARCVKYVLEFNPRARICVVGSQSARNGSYDETYAMSKAAIEAFVRFTKTAKDQQLVCVSPPIIRDSGMTCRRADYPDVLAKRPTCSAADVARAIKVVLYDTSPDVYNNVCAAVTPAEIDHER